MESPGHNQELSGKVGNPGLESPLVYLLSNALVAGSLALPSWVPDVLSSLSPDYGHVLPCCSFRILVA